MQETFTETTTLNTPYNRTFIKRENSMTSVSNKGVFCGNISVVFDDEINGHTVGSRCKVIQNGNEIKDVRKITITIEPEEVLRVDMEIYPRF